MIDIEGQLYLAFGPFAIVFAAVFARVVFGQLVFAELLELVSHGLLQTSWETTTEALEREVETQCLDWMEPREIS